MNTRGIKTWRTNYWKCKTKGWKWSSWSKANVNGEVEANVVEEIITLNFEIEGTKTEIAQVRQFLIDNEISYRMLKKKGE